MHVQAPVWTRRWGIWSQVSHWTKKLPDFPKKEGSHSLSPSLLFKEKCLRVCFRAIQNGEKTVSHKFLWVEKQFLPSCAYTEASRWSWILFPWLHTGVLADRSSDSGVDKVTYAFHSKVQLRRPILWWSWMAGGAHASLPQSRCLQHIWADRSRDSSKLRLH